MSTCILYQDPSSTITILDIPRSIELAQNSSSLTISRRLISATPLQHPYPSVEPKSIKAKANVLQPSLEDLLLQKHLQFALDEVKEKYDGPWCLPRVTMKDWEGDRVKEGRKRKLSPAYAERVPTPRPHEGDKNEVNHVVLADSYIYFHNPTHTALNGIVGPNKEKSVIPTKSTIVQGDIAETLSTFKDLAPKFNLIVLDPPWPNRSARRKQSYSISYGPYEIRSLLSSIQLYDHIVEAGLIAVWVTNKPSFREMVLGEGGLFEQWDLQLVQEWIWLKTTENGDPICALDSAWRKPYEIMLVGQRREVKVDADVRRKVIFGVPDLHSRKPNVKVLLEVLINLKEGEYEGLEIFARNLTSGWWSWGNEVLKFQTEEHWAEP